ncbi:MAG: antibiotic biosynthesis monooxygenase [Gammaproteobacteria bacterium]|nr:antibiotic biosynthesis monooxygenase [Gammaproteobacteria bacterium]
MYVVIFKAELSQLDEDYLASAKRMRQLALENYGCIDFISITENNTELSLSYWETEVQISAWKNDPEHLATQTAARKKWYSSYRVEVSKVERAYAFPVVKQSAL